MSNFPSHSVRAKKTHRHHGPSGFPISDETINIRCEASNPGPIILRRCRGGVGRIGSWNSTGSHGRWRLNMSAHWELLMNVNKAQMKMVDTGCTPSKTKHADAWPFVHSKKHQSNAARNRSEPRYRLHQTARQDNQVLRIGQPTRTFQEQIFVPPSHSKRRKTSQRQTEKPLTLFCSPAE